MTDLFALVASLAVQTGAPMNSTATSPEEWLGAAGDRPAWKLWGKGRPTGGCPAHPLLCHIVDVAAVAAILLTCIAPPALRRRLLGLHPDGEAPALRLLLFVIALHDLGKATPAFQAKLEWARRLLPQSGFDLDPPDGARHHGDVGLGFVREVLRSVEIEHDAAIALARAVTAHHGEFPTDVSLARPPGKRERGAAEAWNSAREDIVAELRTLFGVDMAPHVVVDHAYVALLAGFTAVADWIGSMEDVFAYEPPQPSLAAYWPRSLERARIALEHAGMRDSQVPSARGFTGLFPTFTPWPLHAVADELATRIAEPSMVVIEAPMGEGKTEASLLLADAAAARLGQHGFYFGLPTQATANQMFGRVQSFLERVRSGEASTLVLAHGEADLVDRFQRLRAVYDTDDRRPDGVRAETWFVSKKRALLAEHAVGTIDQALLGVMRTAHAFVRLFGLASKTVVFDEIHAYDTYTSTLLDRLVEWLAAMGSTVLLLSATLPSRRREALVRAYRRGAGGSPDAAPAATNYPRITVVSRNDVSATHFAPRSSPVAVMVESRDGDVASVADEVIASAAAGGCVGWILNTVARAQAACDAIRARAPDLLRLLLHARLLPEDRALRERKLETWLGPERATTQRPERCVVIGTQVLEQSLDVDFDRLYTDIAPIDLILQRAGRLHRHARGNRSLAHPVPRLFVSRPEGPSESVRLDDIARVYPEVLVRETLRVLAGRARLVLPDDIEPLVEAVYSADLPAPDDPLFDASVEYVGATIAERQTAEVRLMPRPTVVDDPFGDLRVTFDDDEDPGLHQQLKAVTRLGPESVDMVCLVQRGGDLFVDEGDTRPLGLSVVPDRALVRRLVRRAIGVSREGLVRELLSDKSRAPDAWTEVALLRHRRVVAFEDGVAEVGGLRLTLDPELGLLIERP